VKVRESAICGWDLGVDWTKYRERERERERERQRE